MADVGLTTLLTAGILSRSRPNPLPMQRYDENAYNADLNTSFQTLSNQEVMTQKIEEVLQKRRIENIRSGKNEEQGVNDLQSKWKDDKILNFYNDELKDMLEESRRGETKMDVNTQLKRLEETLKRLKDSSMDEDMKKFMVIQYSHTQKFLQSEKKQKKGIGGVALESAKNQIGNYLDMRGLFAGLVNNNPLAMAAFNIGSDVTKSIISRRRERKKQQQSDVSKANIVEREKYSEELSQNFDRIRESELESARGSSKATNESKETDESTPTIEPQSPIDLSNEGIAEEQQKEKQKEQSEEQDRANDTIFRDGLFDRLDNIKDCLCKKEEGNNTSTNIENEEESGFFSKFKTLFKFDGLKKILGGFLASAGGIFGLKNIKNIMSTLKGAPSKILDVGKNLVKGAGGKILDVGKGAFNAVKGAPSKILDVGKNLVKGAGGKILDVGKGAMNLAKGAGGKILDIGKGAFNAVKGAGGKILDIGKGAMNLAKGAGGKILDIGKGLGSKALGFAGPAAALASSAYGGWQIGEYLNETFGTDKMLSDAMLKVFNPEAYENKQKRLAEKTKKPAISTEKQNIEQSQKRKDIVETINNKVIESKVNAEKDKSKSMGVVNNVINNNTTTSGGNARTIPLSSARNPDSSVQRMSERFMVFGNI